MALIKCKECGKEFSDMANTCPFCGYQKIYDSWVYKLIKRVLYGLVWFLGILVCLILGRLALLVSENNTSKYTTNKIMKNTMTNEERSRLFSGYQNIKFGMSKAQVKSLFDGRLIQSREKYLEYVKDKAEITFWFFNDTLYEVEVRPNAKKQRPGHRAATEDMQNTINAMVQKYGPYEKKSNMVSVVGAFEHPLEYYRWGFKDKEVVLTYWDLGGWFDANTRNMGSAEYETLTIQYRDLGIKRKKEQETAEKELQKQQHAIQKKRQELEGII